MSSGQDVPYPDRRLIDLPTVRRLVDTQFPDWAHLSLTPVPVGGWDNQTFRLGEQLSVRLPTAAEYAQAVEKEHRWLPTLAAQLPLPIPTPIAMGRPSADFRFSWSVYQWIPGDRADRDLIGDPTTFAHHLAAFLTALQRIDPTDGPAPGIHNWYRGDPLDFCSQQTHQAIDILDDRIPSNLTTEIWQAALNARCDRPPAWFHGDIAPGNLLLSNGTLAAVIDFGTCGVGDPACDLAVAWTLLSGPSRDTFRSALAVDPGTWARGRGWALWKALVLAADALRADDEPAASDPLRVLNEILTEYSASR